MQQPSSVCLLSDCLFLAHKHGWSVLFFAGAVAQKGRAREDNREQCITCNMREMIYTRIVSSLTIVRIRIIQYMGLKHYIYSYMHNIHATTPCHITCDTSTVITGYMHKSANKQRWKEGSWYEQQWHMTWHTVMVVTDCPCKADELCSCKWREEDYTRAQGMAFYVRVTYTYADTNENTARSGANAPHVPHHPNAP